MSEAKTFRDLPLQRKFILQVGLAAALAMLIAAVSLLIFDLTTFRPRAVGEAQDQVHALAAAVRPFIETGDRQSAQASLHAFGMQPGVRALAIASREGDVLAEYRRPGAGVPPFRRLPTSMRAEMPRDIVWVKSDVFDGAAVWMVKDLRPFRQRIAPYLAALGAAALSLLALAVMMSVTIRRAILEPVQALAAAARDVTEKRDYSRRVRTARRDEIGQLAREFNAMLAAVEERSQALQSSEETARRQLAEIENIYQNAGVGLCLLDRDLRFVRINKYLADMNGVSVEETIGRRGADVVPHVAAILDERYRRIIETGEPLHEEVQVRRPGESDARHCISSNYPLRDSAGRIIGITSVVLDITDRKRAEEERTRLEGQLRQSQKMQALGTLAGGIAHDFNNVLTAIGGNARLALQDLPPDHAAVISVREIARGAERAKDLVRRILSFSRQEQGDRRPIELAPVIEEALRLLRATLPQMIEIRFETAPDLPKVLADATQVHQVLMNLGANAMDAMHEHGGVLTVRLESLVPDAALLRTQPALKPRRYVRVSVQDSGCGIDPSTMERMFEPFFTTKPPGRGTGLGLSAVHGIMQAHEGVVAASSELGEGSVFDLYFPVAESVEIAADLHAPASPEPTGAGEHILYVDDEEPLVFLVTRMLERMGYRVTGTTRPADALAAVRASPAQFDLVITDLGMPGMSGLDLAVELLAVRPDLPIIITSGYVRSEDARRAEEIGVRDLVLKPATVAEMGPLLQQRLAEIRGASKSGAKPPSEKEVVSS